MKKFFLYLMAAFYIAAGINHFIHSSMYMNIMPHWLPAQSILVSVSGVCEMVCGVLLLFTNTRRLGAWLAIALLIAVYPANIQMMLDYYHRHNPFLWLAILRLPLQFVLVFWAYVYTKKSESRAPLKTAQNHIDL